MITFSTVCNYLVSVCGVRRPCSFQFCGFCMLCFFSSFSLGQSDTSEFDAVTVIGQHPKIEQHNTYDRQKIQALAPADLGLLLKRVAGAAVADYGGIGSMKTISIRGLGSTHTGVLMNGFPQANPQNGQADLSQFQLENTESASVSIAPLQKIKVPVSSLMQGNTIALQTFQQTFARRPFMARTSATIGSFGQREAYAGFKMGNSNQFLSASGQFRGYEGDFPYTLPHDDEDGGRVRSNNNLNSYNFSLGGGKKWRTGNNIHHRVRLSSQIKRIERSLPGAVILYSGQNNEQLTTQQKQIGGDYSILSERFRLRTFANFSQQQLRYFDPDYLNNQGFIDNRYTNNSLQSGFHGKWMWNALHLHFGSDLAFHQLSSSRDLGNPHRATNISMIGASKQLQLFSVNAALFHHHVSDQNLTLEHHSSYNRWNPQFTITSSENLLKNIQFTLWYKHASRAPTFNELYYSQIGNTSLIPEESQQLNFGYMWLLDKNSVVLAVKGNVFYNNVLNKIVALPTQNLFVWSIQNVGKVQSYGTDLSIELGVQLFQTIRLEWTSSATYQSVTDRSERTSPSYGDQIANTPRWTQSNDLQIKWKQWTLTSSSLYIGERYALNENNVTNQLDAYWVFDANVNYAWKMKKSRVLNVQAGVKNLANRSYYHINYFVMPGRNYFIKLAYEL